MHKKIIKLKLILFTLIILKNLISNKKYVKL